MNNYIHHDRIFMSCMDPFAIGAVIAVKTRMFMKDPLETTIKGIND
jgi:hypothetical protein